MSGRGRPRKKTKYDAVTRNHVAGGVQRTLSFSAPQVVIAGGAADGGAAAPAAVPPPAGVKRARAASESDSEASGEAAPVAALAVAVAAGAAVAAVAGAAGDAASDASSAGSRVEGVDTVALAAAKADFTPIPTRSSVKSARLSQR